MARQGGGGGPGLPLPPALRRPRVAAAPVPGGSPAPLWRARGLIGQAPPGPAGRHFDPWPPQGKGWASSPPSFPSAAEEAVARSSEPSLRRGKAAVSRAGEGGARRGWAGPTGGLCLRLWSGLS